MGLGLSDLQRVILMVTAEQEAKLGRGIGSERIKAPYRLTHPVSDETFKADLSRAIRRLEKRGLVRKVPRYKERWVQDKYNEWWGQIESGHEWVLTDEGMKRGRNLLAVRNGILEAENDELSANLRNFQI